MAAPGLLVIGASQSKYASKYVQNFKGFDVSIISNSGMGVHEVSDSMILATSFFNDVVLHLGTNNIICGQSPEEVVSHYDTLVDKILAGNPNVCIYVSSVLLRAPSKFPDSHWGVSLVERLNYKIKKLNQLLAEFASRRKAYFIENWKKFEEKAKDPFSELLSRDGLHLSPKGVQCLMGNVISFCRKVKCNFLPIPCATTSNSTLFCDSDFPSLPKLYPTSSIPNKPSSSFPPKPTLASPIVNKPAPLPNPVFIPISSKNPPLPSLPSQRWHLLSSTNLCLSLILCLY